VRQSHRTPQSLARILAILCAVGQMACCALCATAADARDPRTKIPEPAVVDLPTRDGFVLKATYFGQPAGKKAPPVVMLHDYMETRNVYAALAQSLQNKGFAVLLPDLRAHGASTTLKLPRPGHEPKVEAGDLRKPDFLRMVHFDMESARRFLVSRNDEEQVNLNQLSLVGSGMGATVALLWTARDWTVPPLAVGKQGQDVKALVLVSPQTSFQGISVQGALKVLGTPVVREQVSILILVGGHDARALRDADKIHRILAGYQPALSGDLPKEKRTLFFSSIDTSLQGSGLLGLETQPWDDDIAMFLSWRITSQDYAWTERRARTGS
jgi:pimeloyl-ACP methyl ester carboxylesterase